MPTVATERTPGSLPWLVLAGGAASAVLAGYIVARDPGFLRLDFSPSLPGLVAAALGLGVAAVVVRRPATGLLLLTAFVYLDLSQVLVRHHSLPSLLQILALPLLLAAWTAGSAAGRRRVMSSPLTLLLALYTLILLLSTTYARDPGLADLRLAENAKALAVYLLVAVLAVSASVVRKAVWVMLGSGALLGGIALAQVLSGDFSNEYGGLARIKLAHIYGETFEPRIAGPLGDPNFFAQILVALVPLALFTAWSERGVGARLLAFACAGLAAAAAVLTYSRGGALVLATVLALSFLSRRIDVRQTSAAAAATVLLLLLFVPADFARRLTTLEQVFPGAEAEVLHPDSSFQKRRLLVGAAWRMFLDHPGLGVGAGNYTVHFDQYADEVGSAAREYEDPGEMHYPHNLYLEIAAETGLIGLAVFAAAVAVALVSLRRARAGFLAAGDERTGALARGFETALVGYLVSGLFLHGHFPRYLWLLLGFAAALTAVAPRHER